MSEHFVGVDGEKRGERRKQSSSGTSYLHTNGIVSMRQVAGTRNVGFLVRSLKQVAGKAPLGTPMMTNGVGIPRDGNRIEWGERSCM